MAQILKRVLSHKMFTRYLLLTNMLISGGVESLGDIIEQKLERTNSINWSRTTRMGMVGLALGIPDHFWYGLLDKHMPGRNVRTISKKILLDMIIMGPPYIAVFYLSMCRLEGKSWKESRRELREKFITTYKLEWTIWPAAQVVNFYFFPTSMRVLFINTINLGWAVILSKLKHSNPDHDSNIDNQHTSCRNDSNIATSDCERNR